MDWDEANRVLQEHAQQEQAEEDQLRQQALGSAGVDPTTPRARLRRAPYLDTRRTTFSAPPSISLSPTRRTTPRLARWGSHTASRLGRVSVSAAAAAEAALVGVSGGAGQGINPLLLELLIEQQKILSGVEAKRAFVPPPPGFHNLSQPEAGPSCPQPIRSSPSILLGAQMGQLSALWVRVSLWTRWMC